MRNRTTQFLLIFGIGLIFFVGSCGNNSKIENGSMSASSTSNSPPVASAGRDGTVFLGDLVILDATGSVDPDGDPLVYYWNFVSRPEGSRSDLNDPRFVHAKFTPDKRGEYILSLLVSDKSGESGQAAVKITVE